MSDQKNIFRKASLSRVSSPEQLNEYIKVSRPGVWLVLAAVVILLIGVCVWSVFGTLTTTQKAMAVVQGGKAVCYVHPGQAAALRPGMEVTVNGNSGSITAVAAAPVEITADFDAYALYLGELQTGDWVVPVTAQLAAPDGVYLAEIVLESISPISFVLN